jgi:hypothetical protein
MFTVGTGQQVKQLLDWQMMMMSIMWKRKMLVIQITSTHTYIGLHTYITYTHTYDTILTDLFYFYFFRSCRSSGS